MTAKIRLRQHTNPLNYRGPYSGTAPDELLGGPVNELEIGPGLGELLVARAKQDKNVRLLGLEVRRAYVEISNEALDKAGINNARAIYAEAKTDLPTLIPDASLQRIYFMFPDPWFKRRHFKRRVMTTDFARLLTQKLRVGAELHWATDSGVLALDIRARLDRAEQLVQIAEIPPAAWLSGRGMHHQKQGDLIFGGCYRRLAPAS